VKATQSPMAMMQAGKGMVSGAPVFSGTRVEIGSMALKNMIAMAFHQDIQKTTVPAWTANSFFSIQAVLPEGATKEQFPDMLRTLIEERFHLVAHRVTSDQTAYALTIAKGGHKMKPPREVDKSGCETWTDDRQMAGAKMCTLSQMADGARSSLTIRTDSKYGPSRTAISKTVSDTEFYAITMPQLAEYLSATILSGASGRQNAFAQVVDRTELPGKWDVVVERVFEDVALSPQDGPTIPIPITPTLIANELMRGFSRMGLGMEKTTAPVEMLVVDSVDQMPTEN
jgi:uncharacterized protein (TIGR03435 family)